MAGWKRGRPVAGSTGCSAAARTAASLASIFFLLSYSLQEKTDNAVEKLICCHMHTG